MNIDRVLSGFKKFLDHGFYTNMTSWQKFGAIFAIEMLSTTATNKIECFVNNNAFLKMILSTENEGEIDIERAYQCAKKSIQQVGKIEVTVPLYDTFTFTEADIDCLYNCIVGG